MKTKDNANFHIVLVTGAIEKNGKILIAQRSYDELQAPGKWSLPGGKVELFSKENDISVLEKTLDKEILEEVNINIKQDLTYVSSSSFVRVDGASVISILFLCRWDSGTAKALEDTINVAWITNEEKNNYDLCEGVETALEKSYKKIH